MRKTNTFAIKLRNLDGVISLNIFKNDIKKLNEIQNQLYFLRNKISVYLKERLSIVDIITQVMITYCKLNYPFNLDITHFKEFEYDNYYNLINTYIVSQDLLSLFKLLICFNDRTVYIMNYILNNIKLKAYKLYIE